MSVTKQVYGLLLNMDIVFFPNYGSQCGLPGQQGNHRDKVPHFDQNEAVS